MSSDACTGCHLPLPMEGLAGSFHQDPWRACTDCHSFHRTNLIHAKDRTFEWAFPDDGAMGARAWDVSTVAAGNGRATGAGTAGTARTTGAAGAAGTARNMDLVATRTAGTSGGARGMGTGASDPADHCRTCHVRGQSLSAVTGGHREALALYHGGIETLAALSPSEACLTCHSVNAGPLLASVEPIAPSAGPEPPRFDEHGSHPYGMPAVQMFTGGNRFLKAGVDPQLPLFSGRLECQTCHQLTAGNDDLLVPYPTKYDLCYGCHRLDR
ncbi:MAG: hypothetical protein KC729_11765 [Candidatus Eisenbacteria bacterium]|uniref:Doubled CXXCH motif domain-containing protein n=1 Tax=Eiseniibacteriota bacterium TaxID=2212470 RepID=A0A956RPM9_UNCEI|nr:hypothetical protein [Candidatus Eisenbacteria bacterium]